MSGRATDEACISRERGERVAGGTVLARQQKVQSDAPISREDAVTGRDDLAPLRKRNQEFTEKYLRDKRVIQVAKDLLKARDDGLASFENIVLEQVRATAQAVAATEELVIGRQVAVLIKIMIGAARARRDAGQKHRPDFSILSLYRAEKAETPHGGKRAIDIGVYAGRPLLIFDPTAVSEGVTQFYRDLAAHSAEIEFDYGFGLPRNLRTDEEGIMAELRVKGGKVQLDDYAAKHAAIYGRSIGCKITDCNQKIFDEIQKKYKYVDVFFEHNLTPGNSPTKYIDTDIKELIWSGLATDWAAIRAQGGKRLKSIFPDEFDHLHVQYMP